MSSRDQHSPRSSVGRRGFLTGFALLPGLLLGGCLQPVYGPLSEGGGRVGQQMQAIAVDQINGRLGHYLGDELIFAFNGTGSQVPPRYHLTVTLRETNQTALIDTVTGYPTSNTVVVAADYRLVPVGATEPVVKGTATVAASYDRTDNRFADVRASRDAEIRDARTLANQIRTQIAAQLSTRS